MGINFDQLLEKGKEKVKQTVETVTEEVTEKVEWLEEKIAFTERKKDFLKYLKNHNITAPEWLTKLSSTEVVKKLGLSPEDNTWQQYLKEGGFALLIYKFAGPKKLALNAGLYLGLIKQGKKSF